MLNLIRMDLYRLRKSKSVYICFAILAAMHILCYVMVFLMGTEEGRAIASGMGMSELVLEEGDLMLDGQDSLMMFRESYMDGGGYALVLGIVLCIFLCTDFQGGFVKNILTHHRTRWKYIASKLITAGILNGVYIILGLMLNGLLNLMFGTMVPFTGIGTQLFYFAWIWLLTTAYACLVIMLCVITRSLAVGVLAAVFVSSGSVVVPIYSLTSFFGMGGWFPYTLYYNISYGPSEFSSAGDLKIFAIGLVFLVVYAAASMISITRRDV